MAEGAVQARLAAWKAEGADRHDPVGFRILEALATRALRHGNDSPVARVLQRKLALRLASYENSLAQEPAMHGVQAGAAATADRGQPGPLAGLLAQLHAQAGPPPANGTPAAAELRSVRNFRGTWSRLRTEQRLNQSLAKVPENAGPLHSHQLVHRALTLMRDLSPAYLQRFMSHVDALLWLEHAQDGTRIEAAVRPGRNKPAG